MHNLAVTIIAIFTCLIRSNGQTGFLVELSKQNIIFGESLSINIDVTVNEEITNPVIQIRISNNLAFTQAHWHSQLCHMGADCQTYEKSYQNDSQFFVDAPEFIFDNRVIEESKNIIIFQNKTSTWHVGCTFKSVLQIDDLWSTDVDQNLNFVIGIFRYQEMSSILEYANESAVEVEHVSGKYFSLRPVNISIFLEGKPCPNRSDLMSIFNTIEVVVEIDSRVGDALIKFPLPDDLLITQALYTLGNEDGADTYVELPKPVDNELSLLLTEFDFKNSAATWCRMNWCKVKLIVVVMAYPHRINDTAEYQDLSIKATVFYGKTFQSKTESDTILLRLLESQSTTTIAPTTPASEDLMTTGHQVIPVLTNASTDSEQSQPNLDLEYEREGETHEQEIHVQQNISAVENTTVDRWESEIDSNAHTEVPCRKEWWTLEPQMNDECYYFPNKKLAFSDAENLCYEMGAHLPSFHSPYGYLTLSTFWFNNIAETEIWLGLSKTTNEQQWMWTDKSKYDYDNWCDVEPSETLANCTVISDADGDNYCWLNKSCDEKFYFFCAEKAKHNGSDLWRW